jgi:glycosyltransferase
MLISVLTATYNSSLFLKDAFHSFAKQTYKAKELIVIDGASKDSTLKIIQDHQTLINQFISEPDQGIYDALNKGIALAKGDVIGILHSDDFFASDEVLSKVAQLFATDPELEAVYGDLDYVDRIDPNKMIRKWKSGVYNFQKLKQGWMPPHPALFIKKDCFTKYGNYNLQYRSAADYDLILRFLFKHKIKTAYLPQVLVKMRIGGLSNQSFKNRRRANQEDYQALKSNGVSFPFIVSIIKPLRKLGQYFKLF